MKAVESNLHSENIPLFVNDVPYVKEYADGSVDYCLGSDYESAGKVIRALVAIREERSLAKFNKTKETKED